MIEVKEFDKAYEDGELIGHSNYGDQHKHSFSSFQTFFLIYTRPEEEGGNGIEELDVWSRKGREYEVAKAIADAGYNPGFELKSHDDYYSN